MISDARLYELMRGHGSPPTTEEVTELLLEVDIARHEASGGCLKPCSDCKRKWCYPIDERRADE